MEKGDFEKLWWKLLVCSKAGEREGETGRDERGGRREDKGREEEKKNDESIKQKIQRSREKRSEEKR